MSWNTKEKKEEYHDSQKEYKLQIETPKESLKRKDKRKWN